MVPFACLSAVPWRSGLDAKLMLAKFSHLASFVTIVRDKDTGTIFPDPHTGRPRIAYVTSDFDREHALQGMEAVVKICYVQGALEVLPYVAGLEPLRVDQEARRDFEAKLARGEVKDPEFSDPKLKAWLIELWRLGRSQPLAPVGSAHQMGTCRMASSAEEGVVDPKGKVWGREGLYVADASVFPSASGVNPMITNLAISDMISRGVSEDLGAH
jgi:choline dehydrogenase-like flavoprotein